jgi:multiple sugar transport system ATP-binding protein
LAEVVLDEVTVVHRDGTVALAGLSLAVADGELLVLTGPSGSGKTTTLRVIAGLLTPASGQVLIGGEVVNDLPPQDRDVALVPQEHALYPHLTVRQNLAFPLRLRGASPAEVDRRVTAESRVLGLSRLLGRFPRTLSAGARQSVAIGRATARTPRVFLLDEPLASLDALQRARLRRELRAFLDGLAVTTVYVTNDQVEALAVGHRVAVLRDGVLEQVAPPAELLARPVNRFVAGFTGVPAMRFAAAVVEEDRGTVTYRLGDQRLRVPAGTPGPLRGRDGRRVVLGLRAHHLRPATPGEGPRLHGVVTRVEREGAVDLVLAEVAASGGTAVVAARYDPGTGPPVGSAVELAVDAGELAVFDATTGAALWHGRQAASS